jgi:hypothetical protein
MVALGALFTWGTDAAVGRIELSLVGVSLIASGAVGIVAAILLYVPGRSGSHDDLTHGRS